MAIRYFVILRVPLDPSRSMDIVHVRMERKKQYTAQKKKTSLFPVAGLKIAMRNAFFFFFFFFYNS